MTVATTPLTVSSALSLIAAAFLLVLPAQTARAQSVPVTTIENAAGDSVLVSYENGSLAVGINTTAGGATSMAMGGGTTASGLRSVAMGVQTTASGDGSVAMGYRTTAGGAHAMTMGNQTTASNNNATAIGFVTTASG